ncbi:MAG: hypothetical protein Q8K92_26160 [Leadbetterella sp.]|nr:hypothetical protein [Leadbetterella sp.]
MEKQLLKLMNSKLTLWFLLILLLSGIVFLLSSENKKIEISQQKQDVMAEQKISQIKSGEKNIVISKCDDLSGIPKNICVLDKEIITIGDLIKVEINTQEELKNQISLIDAQQESNKLALADAQKEEDVKLIDTLQENNKQFIVSKLEKQKLLEIAKQEGLKLEKQKLFKINEREVLKYKELLEKIKKTQTELSNIAGSTQINSIDKPTYTTQEKIIQEKIIKCKAEYYNVKATKEECKQITALDKKAQLENELILKDMKMCGDVADTDNQMYDCYREARNRQEKSEKALGKAIDMIIN